MVEQMVVASGRRRVSARLATVATVVALLVAACGSGDGSSDGDGESSVAASSPLGEFLGQPDFLDDPEAAQAQFAEEERERQDVIAQCMQRQGFEYTPVDYSQFDTFDEAFDDWGSDEWVAEWGFGITTQRFSQQQVGANLKGWDDSQFSEAEAEFVDPNQDYVESLSDAERDAYYEALYGGDDAFPAFDESLSDEEIEEQMDGFEFEPQGCEGEAYSSDTTNEFYIEFEDELEDMYERMQADPRIEERNAEIASCVADKGHDYTTMDDVYERFEEDLQAMDPFMNGFEPDFGVTEEEMAEMSDDELEELFSEAPDMPELSDEDKAKLGELQSEEIELAVAVNECGGGFDNEFEMMADIRAEYEQEFLDTYAEQLEGFGADA